MGRLIVSCSVSLDGYLNDADGRFDWSAPDEEEHAFVNAHLRDVGTFLFGRRMYETMRVWDDLDVSGSPAMAEFAEYWAGTDKVVYSTTLDPAEVAGPRTRLERTFDVDAVRALVEASDHDVEVAGATLAAHAFRAGIVDELALFLVPVVVGGGTRLLPDGVRLDLELVEEHRFPSGIVYLRYLVRR